DQPLCPAWTPRFQNCVIFATAAAAYSAEFRPCLRCRPEIGPELGLEWDRGDGQPCAPPHRRGRAGGREPRGTCVAVWRRAHAASSPTARRSLLSCAPPEPSVTPIP